MPAFSVKLAHLYQIDLAQAKIERKDWDAQPVQYKMRKFFLGATGQDWAAYVTAVRCSTGGAKGVFFLDLKGRTIGQGPSAIQLAPAMCALKATSAPQQALFAEYILHALGNAKIPKSLVVKLNWPEYKKQNYDAKTSSWGKLNMTASSTDDGLRLLGLIMNQPGNLSEEEWVRYDELTTGLFTNQPSHFVIMKGLRIDNKLDFPVSLDPTTRQWKIDFNPGANPTFFSPFIHRMVDPFDQPNQRSTNKSYQLASANTIKEALNSWWDPITKQIGFARKQYPNKADQLQLAGGPALAALPPWYRDYAYNNKAFGKVLTRILLNKTILGSADLMKKAGRILAVDTLIGNTDRFEGSAEGMNIGNAFFYSKTYRDRQRVGKARNPIAVIDNDVTMTLLDVFTPEGSLGMTQGLVALDSTNSKHASQLAQYGSTYTERVKARYLEYVLERGLSTFDPNGGGKGVFPYPNLKKLFADFDLYIADQLVRTLIPPRWPLITAIYGDDGTIAPGIPNTYARYSDTPYNGSAVHPTWAPVIGNIKAGFLEGMDAILNLDIDHYRAVYSRLLRLYGIADHFDFTAFELRWMYITQGPVWQRSLTTGKVTSFQHDNTRHANVLARIKQDYLGKTNPSKEQIETALVAAENNQQLSKADRRLATELLRLQLGCP